MKNSRMFSIILVFVLLALAIGVTWVVAQSNVEQSQGYEGRLLVYNSCSSGVCKATCPDGYILTGGGGQGSPLQWSYPSCAGDSCVWNEADSWVVASADGGQTTVLAICFQERFGSFIPLTTSK